MNSIETNLFTSIIGTQTVPTEFIILTETELKMNKKDVDTKKEANPYLGTIKRSVSRVIFNPDYQKTVNDQRDSEGKEADFEASERKWGTSLGNGIIDKNGKLYVSYIHVNTVESKYIFDGEEIEYEKLKAFIPTKKSSGNQGVDQEVQFRIVAVENIKSWF